MFRRLKSCHNVEDMRLLAKQRLPGPIFHYIDGAADDEVTYRRNTRAFDECDLVPNVLAGVENVDLPVTVMGVKLDMPIFCSPTALQRLCASGLLPHMGVSAGSDHWGMSHCSVPWCATTAWSDTVTS